MSGRLRSPAAVLAATLGGASIASASVFDLAAAIEAAPPGAVVKVPAGVHPGPVVVAKRVTIEGTEGAVLQGPGRGDVLEITAAGVVVRGLVIRSTGTELSAHNAGIEVDAPDAVIERNVFEDVLFGVVLNRSPRSVVRGNRIRGMDLPLGRRGDAIRVWWCDEARIEDNEISASRDVVVWYSRNVRIVGNRVTKGRYGLHFMYASDAWLERNRLEDNSVGVYLMYSDDIVMRDNRLARNRGPSGFGLGLKGVDRVEARGNRIIGNRVGMYVDDSPASPGVENRFEGNVLACNDVGIEFMPAVRGNGFAGNYFVENVEQISVLGAGEFRGNDFTPGGRGNYWSDYAGFDLAGDGAGDVPYRSESLFENLMDREKSLRLFLFSPAQQTIELAARSLPAIQPRAKIVDTAPWMEPPPADPAGEPRSSRWPFAAIAGTLGLGSLLAIREGRDHADTGRRRASRAARADSAVLPEPHIRLTGVRKRFGRFAALDGLDLAVEPGESVALWGRNGAGKTTAIRCILGLHRYEGTIEVAGVDARRRGREARRLLGYVPQELAFHDDLRTRETLAFHARLKRVPVDRVDAVLRQVAMEEHGAKRIRELSGGMKQRVALASALLADPPILLLDEMTSNLDQAGRSGFLNLLGELKHGGKTLLFTSHRLDEVRRLADRVVVLESGRVHATCLPVDLPSELGMAALLRLRIDRSAHAAAREILDGMGFRTSANGSDEVRVRVPLDRKMDAIRALDRASVAFDVEIESLDEDAPPPGGSPEGS